MKFFKNKKRFASLMVLSIMACQVGTLGYASAMESPVKHSISNLDRDFDKERFGQLKRVGLNTWESYGGLIYGKDTGAYPNKVVRVISHYNMYSVTKSEITAIIDEAWNSDNKVEDLNNAGTYYIDMNRVIGSNGETTMKIIVKRGTNEVVDCYPVR